jgi:hypothetical protein
MPQTAPLLQPACEMQLVFIRESELVSKHLETYLQNSDPEDVNTN